MEMEEEEAADEAAVMMTMVMMLADVKPQTARRWLAMTTPALVTKMWPARLRAAAEAALPIAVAKCIPTAFRAP
jgi:hypothetical protein